MPLSLHPLAVLILVQGQGPLSLEGHKDTVTCLAYAPDGRTLATGAKSGNAILWDLTARKPRFTLAGHGRAVTAVAFSSDGCTLASAGAARTVLLWDVATLTGRDRAAKQR